jgi:hypothetical protein
MFQTRLVFLLSFIYIPPPPPLPTVCCAAVFFLHFILLNYLHFFYKAISAVRNFTNITNFLHVFSTVSRVELPTKDYKNLIRVDIILLGFSAV